MYKTCVGIIVLAMFCALLGYCKSLPLPFPHLNSVPCVMRPLYQLNLLRSAHCIQNVFAKSTCGPFRSFPSKLQLVPSTYHLPVRCAGHSHWKNVKHIKEAKDAEKQKVTLSVLQRMRVAVREGGGTNPKLNSTLAKVIDDGKTKDVPMTTMTEMLRKLEKAKDVKGSQVFVEAKGVDKCMLIIETYTDRPKWTRQNLQHVLKKYGGTIGEAGTSIHSFNLKGVVYLQNDEANVLTKDQALEAAIEAGAEDVVEGYDDYDRPAYQFICDPKATHAVRKALSAKGLQIGVARQEFIAHARIQFDEPALQKASEMLDELEALEDVVKVYDNIESSSEGSA